MTFLIATLFSCEDANELISKMRTYRTSEENRSELIQVVKDSTNNECDWDAKADWWNGVKSLLLWSKPKAKVTYRGITYDTENRPNQTQRLAERQEIYRGVKFLVDSEGHKRILTAAWHNFGPYGAFFIKFYFCISKYTHFTYK